MASQSKRGSFALSQSGYEEERFERRVAIHFKCPICLDVLRSAFFNSRLILGISLLCFELKSLFSKLALPFFNGYFDILGIFLPKKYVVKCNGRGEMDIA